MRSYLLAFNLLAAEDHKKKEIEQFINAGEQMEKYLDTKVFQHLRDTSLDGVKSQEKNVVICFAAINNFNKLIHALPPKKLLILLNQHYAFMNEITDKYQGTIDKVIGPILMVFWNHPIEQPKAAELAIKAGIAMLKKNLLQIPIRKELGISDFSIKIGINMGSVVVGNLGSKDFKNYTAIGDTINTAQRLMAMSSPGSMMVNEHIVACLPASLKSVKKISNIKLKGKAWPINAYAYDHTSEINND